MSRGKKSYSDFIELLTTYNVWLLYRTYSILFILDRYLYPLFLYPRVFEYFHILLCITVWLGSLAVPRQKIKIGILEIPPACGLLLWLALWLCSYCQIYLISPDLVLSSLRYRRRGDCSVNNSIIQVC